MRSLVSIIAVTSFVLPGAARADTVVMRSSLSPMATAPMLLDACLERDPGIHCDPYIAGVVDSIIANRMVFQHNQVCIPPYTPIDSFRSVTIEFIRGHPEFPPNANAASAVVTAITEAYPCPEAGSKSP
jgi:hypothetical protein